jgi:PAS domain S-box-containing protein
MFDVRSGADHESQLESLFARRELLDSLATGLLLFGNDGNLLDCNRAGLDLLGITRDQLAGLAVSDPRWGAVHEDGTQYPADERPTMVTMESGEPCSDVIVGIDNPGMARRWLSNSTYPVTFDGSASGVLSSLVDVSNRVQKEHLLRLLTGVNRVVMSASHESDPLQSLCTTLVEQGHYALAWIGVASNVQEGEINIACAAGVTDYPYDGMVSWSGSKETGSGPVGTALRTGITQVLNDLTNESLFGPWRERASQFGLTSCVAIPFAPGARRAVLAIYDRHIFAFDETTVQGLEEIAREAEFGIAHVLSTKRLEAALDGTIAALARMTETRDPYTAGHQLRVGSLGSSLGAAIATQHGLDAKMIELVRQSGEVHDIGKIAVPAEILSRPGRLSSLEFELVKRHTLVGYDILSQASLPWPIAEVALQHHERMDGSGYPNGLLGGDIILPARIIAVADVVEAMTQHRPYRPGLGIDIALAEVTAGAGTLFDADVVKSCLAVFEAGFTFGTS